MRRFYIKKLRKDENCSLKHLQVGILNAVFHKTLFGSKNIVENAVIFRSCLPTLSVQASTKSDQHV